VPESHGTMYIIVATPFSVFPLSLNFQPLTDIATLPLQYAFFTKTHVQAAV